MCINCSSNNERLLCKHRSSCNTHGPHTQHLSRRVRIMILTSDEKEFAALGLAHFTVLEVPPLELVSLAAGIGYASIGLRLYPAFPGAPFYELPPGTASSQQMRSRLRDEGIQVHDIEFVTIDADFSAARLAG